MSGKITLLIVWFSIINKLAKNGKEEGSNAVQDGIDCRHWLLLRGGEVHKAGNPQDAAPEVRPDCQQIGSLHGVEAQKMIDG